LYGLFQLRNALFELLDSHVGAWRRRAPKEALLWRDVSEHPIHVLFKQLSAARLFSRPCVWVREHKVVPVITAPHLQTDALRRFAENYNFIFRNVSDTRLARLFP